MDAGVVNRFLGVFIWTLCFCCGWSLYERSGSRRSQVQTRSLAGHLRTPESMCFAYGQDHWHARTRLRAAAALSSSAPGGRWLISCIGIGPVRQTRLMRSFPDKPSPTPRGSFVYVRVAAGYCQKQSRLSTLADSVYNLTHLRFASFAVVNSWGPAPPRSHPCWAHQK